MSDHPLYAKLADELKLPLHAGGWATVLGDEKLRADQIHANAAGYRAFAEGLAATLRSTGLLIAATVRLMLAYRHAFHAGNHADVLKHLVLAQVLVHMAAKDKPFTYIDTHAGAGGYSLESRYAQKNAESTGGIERLWSRDDLPAALAHYVSLVREFNGGGKLEQYPGSPAIANLLLRPTTRCMRTNCTRPTSASCAPTWPRAATQGRCRRRLCRAAATSCRRRRAAASC